MSATKQEHSRPVANTTAMTVSYWVTIGFNNDPDPATHVEILRRLFKALDFRLVTEMKTLGEWKGEQETGHAFLIQGPSTSVSPLRAALVASAKRHNQQAIGLVGGVGSSTYVEAIQ